MATEVQAPARNHAAETIVQMGLGYMYTASIYNAARLNIADLLAGGPRRVSDLAAASKTNEDALYRVLRPLAAAGVFAETAPRTFSLTPTGELLRSGVPGSMKDLVVWMGNRFHFDVWADMPYSLETGKPAVDHLYGKPVFDCLPDMPEVAREFHTAMTVLSSRIAPAVTDAYDFTGVGVLMDVAGGHGRTLCEILDRYPRMKGIVFDLAPVTAGANELIRSRKLESRCRTLAGDFFRDIPSGADAYYMQHIIHDWADEQALKILRNTRRALEGRPNGRLLIVDCVLPDTPQPHLGHLMDLEMLLMPGGRERTAGEFRALLGNAGFALNRIVPTTAPESVVEARPV